MKAKFNWSDMVAFILSELFFGQRELAKHCNVTQQSISNWKQQVRRPGPHAKGKLLEILQNAGVSSGAFRSSYSENIQEISDVALRELVEIYNKLETPSQTNLLEFARFQKRSRKFPVD